ncbi:MAG TPA: PAS domain S-box protein [Polyangium sp.]|nr:PAS domain S-box protein [Polyangium sp.]
MRKLQAGDYEGAARALEVSHAATNDLIHALAELAGDLAHERKVREARLGALMDVVTQIAIRNYSVRAEISDAKDAIDGVAVGLNMLREELQSTTVSRAYLDNIFASLPDALFVTTPNGVVRSVNNAGVDMLGYTRKELVGQPLLEFVPLELSVTSNHQLRGEQLMLVDKQGTSIIVSCSVSALYNESRLDGFVCVLHDITGRKRADEERQRLHDELREQAELIRKMSAPLIPISDEIMVMPLVGAVDPARAEQILTSILTGIAANHPRVAIIDITALVAVDADVANTILRAAGAARLLGVDVYLTGMRAEVARTLIETGLDLSGIVTCSTLKTGIALSTKRIHDRSKR